YFFFVSTTIVWVVNAPDRREVAPLQKKHGCAGHGRRSYHRNDAKTNVGAGAAVTGRTTGRRVSTCLRMEESWLFLQTLLLVYQTSTEKLICSQQVVGSSPTSGLKPLKF